MFEESTIKIFTKILNFVTELNTGFGDKYPNVRLYYKFLSKTPISKKVAMEKQNGTFRTFLSKNKDAVIKQDANLFQDDKISYSEKVFINIKEIIQEAVPENKKTIFKHLQLVSYLFTGDQDMKDAITGAGTKSVKEVPQDDGQENKFIDNFMTKIESSFADKDFKDPMEATMNLLQSGIFTDMINTMHKDVTSGKLNVNKLLGNVQGMMGKLTQDIGDGGQDNPMNMLNSMLSNNGGENPFMSMMSGMMGGNQSNVNNVMGMMSGMMNSLMTPQSEGGLEPTLSLEEKKESDL